MVPTVMSYVQGPIVQYGTDKLDLVFLFHTSDNIDNNGWQAYKDFMTGVISRAGDGDVKVGAVFYNSNGGSYFNLRQYRTLADTRNAINGLALKSSSDANIASGMDIVRQQLFTPFGGDRPDVPNAVILVTDADANINTDQIAYSAQRLRRESGARIYTAGIGLVGSSQFHTIASSGSTSFWADSTGDLGLVRDDIFAQVPPCKKIARSHRG